jgi:hypothetical protein
LGDNGKTSYYCHNCGASFTLGRFLKEVAPDLYTSYRLENLGEIFKVNKNQPGIEDKIRSIQTDMMDPLIHCTPLTNAALNPSTVQYAKDRFIPERVFPDLLAVSNINLVTKRIDKYKDPEFPELPALVIPFYKKDGSYDFIQCRVSKETAKEFRFVTLQTGDGPKLWGQRHLDWAKPIYVFEGPIDAMFVENAVALAGAASGLDYIIGAAKTRNLPMHAMCMAFDNDYRSNPQIMKLLRRSVEKGFSVVLFDKHFDQFKDVNDAVKIGGWSVQEVDAYVRSRTFHGMRAQLELTAITKRW